MARHAFNRGCALAGMIVGIGWFGPAGASHLPGVTSSTNCSATERGELRSIITDLYGGNGITLQPNGHDAHFCANTQSALANLGDLISSSVTLFTSFNTIDTNPSIAGDRSLGPLVGERAVTVGKGAFHLGFGYAHADFKTLNGRPLSEQVLEFQHIDSDVPDSFPDPIFENDLVRSTLDISVSQDQYAFIATYGLFDRFDVGVVVPLVNVDASVVARGEIVPRQTAFPGIHQPGAESLNDSISRSASGLGDVIVRGKYMVSQADEGIIPFFGPRNLDVAILGQVAFPTGDEADLLGTGSTTVKGVFIASTSLNRFNPIINVGYEHFFDDDFNRSNLNYVVGVDVRASKSFSVAAEVLGRYEFDDDGFTDPSFRLPDLTTIPPAQQAAALTPPLLNDEHRIDLSVGFKWVPFGNIPFRANVLLPLNKDRGLRPDFVITLGLEASF